ncbi:MAG: hypothetical protein KAH95_15535 [Spirochaetales bacterium]|nr:hypothetical protein [Spirochaetales bacterium]
MIVEYITKFTFHFWYLVLGSLFLILSVLILVPLVIINLPSDYFLSRENKGILNNLSFPFNFILIMLKNGIGLILICFGILLLFLPGQGLITIFTGLMLLNFPGKRGIELFIVRKRPVLNAINWIRFKAGKEKIVEIFDN